MKRRPPKRSQAPGKIDGPRKIDGPGGIDGLNAEDPGIGLLAAAVAGVPSREILLVCSGDVPGVGPEATRLILDVRERVGAVARTVPLQLGGPPKVEPASAAVVWPRAHLGKDFTLQCLAWGALALRPGGRLLCAVRKDKGAEGIAEAMGELLGDVRVLDRDRGYRLLASERDDARLDAAKLRELTEVAYEIDAPLVGPVRLRSAPGVFSRRELDAGTRCLIERASTVSSNPVAVLDLCAGIGPLAAWALGRWPAARALAIDSNVLAVELCRINAERLGVAERLAIELCDGLPDTPSSRAPAPGTYELALVNPPTHADPETLQRLLGGLRGWLRPGAPALVVASRPGRVLQVLQAAGARTTAHEHDRYTVVEASFVVG